MDLITQGLLGATIGQAFFTRRLGRQAVVVGALAGLAPDADVFIQYLSNDPFADIKYHRWLTHSFWFGLVLSPPWAYWLAKKRIIQYSALTFSQRFKSWFWLLFLGLFTHPVLDIFTTYGTQFFVPFSDVRLHWNAIAIIDIGYSLILIIALIAGWRFDRNNTSHRGQRWGQIALLLSTLYLGTGLAINKYTVSFAQHILPEYTIKAHPTLFQLIYRKVYAYHTHETCVSYYTIFKPHTLHFQCRKRQYDDGIAALLTSATGQTYRWFTDDEYWIERDPHDHALIRMHDIRFSLPHSSFTGLWGIEARITSTGQWLSEPQRFTTPRPSLRALWETILQPAVSNQP